MMDILYYIDVKTLLVIIVILFSYWYFRGEQKLPPGPLRLPVVGNIFWLIELFFSTDQPFVKCLQDSKKYNDLLYLKFGNQGFLFVNGYDALHEVLVQNSGSFNDRPHWIIPELEYLLRIGRGLVWESGEDWKKMRKFTMQHLKEFGVGKASLEEKILTEIDATSKVLRETSGDPHDVKRHIAFMIANVIYGICFGQRRPILGVKNKCKMNVGGINLAVAIVVDFSVEVTDSDGLTVPQHKDARQVYQGSRFDYNDEIFDELITKLELSFHRGNPIDISRRLPGFVMKLMGRDKAAEAHKWSRANSFITGHISSKINEHEESYDGNNIRDFVDLFIQNRRATEDKHIFTDGNLFIVIMDLFSAGSETTSNTILWSILYMMEYPDVQTRCQEEIHEKYGEQEIRWSHRNTLPYVEATLLEIQRLANIAPFSAPHTNVEETTVRGYTIPKHTIVLANLYSSNMDDKHWDDPEQFRPERFIEDGRLKKSPAFVPFSIGPRACAGETLAKMEMFLTFCNFLQRFTFKREQDNVPNSFESERFLLTSTPNPFKTRIIERT